MFDRKESKGVNFLNEKVLLPKRIPTLAEKTMYVITKNCLLSRSYFSGIGSFKLETVPAFGKGDGTKEY